MQPDAVLYAISQYNLSAGRFRSIAARLTQATTVPSALVRLEETNASIGDHLDMLVAEGHRTILVQPVGLPFAESLRAWLPGALGHWLESAGRDDLDIRIGGEVIEQADILETLAAAALEKAGTAKPVTTANTSLGKPGWDEPPDFDHHLIVCTGPRCQYRDAASLIAELKAELSRRDVAKRCLTTRTGCMFPCNKGPMVAVYPKGEWYRLGSRDAVERFVEAVIVEGRSAPDLLFHRPRTARAAPEFQ